VPREHLPLADGGGGDGAHGARGRARGRRRRGLGGDRRLARRQPARRALHRRRRRARHHALGAARQVTPADFDDWDLLLCADRKNAAALIALAPDAAGRREGAAAAGVRSGVGRRGGARRPDPYLGEDGFDAVLDVIEAACAGLLERLQRRRAGARR
jgi:protein-tyrosine phosphatase